jgi:cysteine-rich repeat protein
MKRNYLLVLGMVAVGAVQAAACSSKFDSCADSRTCAASAGGEAGAPPSADLAGSAGDNTVGIVGDGDAGSAGTSSGPTLFGACSVLGAVVCQGVASAQRLACDGKKWQAGTTCGEGERCDSRSGECAKTIAECASAMPGQAVCRGDSPLVCGPDLVSEKLSEPCDGACKDGVCHAPICGDKKVEDGETCDDGDLTNTGACPKMLA